MVEHPRILIVVALLVWGGCTLLLAETRWFRRMSLAQRLTPFGADASLTNTETRAGVSDLITPTAIALGEWISRALGISDSLATRIARARLELDATEYRVRQLSWACGLMILAAALMTALRPAPPIILLFVLGAPLLVFLVLEQQVTAAARTRQERIFNELPVVSEQLAMLLNAGFSLGAAINRLAERSHGEIGKDLNDVRDRLRHGLTTKQALQEWANSVGLPEVDRLVAVLSLSSETSDLGRLVSEEAKGIRTESQRRLAAVIDKRSQQVWIPVTVATLVPGVIFLTIPFLQALKLFSGA